jgi:hypothetical protein
MFRRSTVVIPVLLALLAPLSIVHAAAAADGPTGLPIQVPLVPADPTGPKGLAVLSVAETGTSVQVLAPGVAAGTTAVIHPGSCAAVGPELVGLIGELAASGQAQALVPVPLATLADGSHVVALHPGLDFATVLTCGLIPASGLVPQPVPATPEPVVDEACAGVPEWIAATKARLDRVTELEKELAKQSANYLPTLANNIGQLGVMISQMQAGIVPPAAAAAHERLIRALQEGVQAGRDVIESFSTADLTLYQDALAKAKSSADEILQVRTLVGELEARCPAPAPAG